MKVLLVDDKASFSKRLSDNKGYKSIEIIGIAHNRSEVLHQTAQLQPDVILINAQLPKKDGVETTRIIKKKFPLIKVIILAPAQNDLHLFESIKAGASGYMLKNDFNSLDAFWDRLDAISRGEFPLSPALVEKLLKEFARLGDQLAAVEKESFTALPLTTRQINILKFAVQGYTYKEIGEHFSLSESTIKYHMNEIAHRLHLKNRSQVLAFTAKIGISLPTSASSLN